MKITKILTDKYGKDHLIIIDDFNADLFDIYSWKYLVSTKHVYTTIKRKTVRLHRMLMNAEPGQEVDHIDLNRLNMAMSNLRFCTRSQNVCNTISKGGAGAYKGVTWYNITKKWIAKIGINNKLIHIGTFHNAEDAARAYDTMARKLHGEFARLNFPEYNERCGINL